MRGRSIQIKAARYLTVDHSRELKKDLLTAREQGVTDVVLDFSDTETIDSSGLGKLLLFNEVFTDAGGSLQIINVRKPEVKELFELINLAKYLTVTY